MLVERHRQSGDRSMHCLQVIIKNTIPCWHCYQQLQQNINIHQCIKCWLRLLTCAIIRQYFLISQCLWDLWHLVWGDESPKLDKKKFLVSGYLGWALVLAHYKCQMGFDTTLSHHWHLKKSQFAVRSQIQGICTINNNQGNLITPGIIWDAIII